MNMMLCDGHKKQDRTTQGRSRHRTYQSKINRIRGFGDRLHHLFRPSKRITQGVFKVKIRQTGFAKSYPQSKQNMPKFYCLCFL